MLKNLRYKIAFLLTAVSLAALPVAVPAVASAADIQNSLCRGTTLNVNSGDCSKVNGTAAGNKLNNTITTIVNVFSIIVGVVAVIMIIIGGLRYVTSGGDSNAVSGAKNTIIYAIVGLIVVALAQAIVQFVLKNVG